MRQGSYAHGYKRLGSDDYVISWCVDFKAGRLRSPRRYERDTNLAGAVRFARKWGLPLPGTATSRRAALRG